MAKKKLDLGKYIKWIKVNDQPLYAFIANVKCSIKGNKITVTSNSDFLADQIRKCAHEIRKSIYAYSGVEVDIDVVVADKTTEPAPRVDRKIKTQRAKIAENIVPTLDSITEQYVNFAKGRFIDNVRSVFDKHDIKSPIEQLLFAALCFKIETRQTDHISITPQYVFKPYRADFLVDGAEVALIVECDSQEFHERTEEERRYEKERDRFFQKHGYRVFRYTGKEILEDPISIADEIISYVCCGGF